MKASSNKRQRLSILNKNNLPNLPPPSPPQRNINPLQPTLLRPLIPKHLPHNPIPPLTAKIPHRHPRPPQRIPHALCRSLLAHKQAQHALPPPSGRRPGERSLQLPDHVRAYPLDPAFALHQDLDCRGG
ncbi:hypothetical protein THAR02_05218 [Trichoderma harzianum]|uniref:Uncharacterized protein n=1 Tax=Trichoderma harzianum TaxID=5544 RepID=A0A0F9XDK1_TRIHA|nr:hypothetical protein THAR02_05218 [Trichoderma harzianum]